MFSAPRPGEVLDGKFRVERVLGVGGMGVVVAAHHLQLDELVALKFLLPQGMSDPQLVARFLREGRAVAKIRSEHVARVFDVGTLENGAPYLVMEHLAGQDLSQLSSARGQLPVGEVVDYILQASEAVADAHVVGIVHRDLKPQNLFLTTRRDGSSCVKVLDFGISKALDSATAGMTGTAALMGSPLYMSPEQMTSARDVDLRTDIWALGVVLFELLCGKTPFEAETMPALILQVVQQPPPPPTSLRPDLPPALERVILRCLEKDPAARYANVAELARALAPFGPPERAASVERISRILGVASTATEAPAASASTPSTQTSVTAAAWGQTLPERGGGRGKLLVGAGLLALVASGAVTFGLRAARAPAVTESSALPPPAAAAPVSAPHPVLAALPAAPVASAEHDAAAQKAPAAPPRRAPGKPLAGPPPEPSPSPPTPAPAAPPKAPKAPPAPSIPDDRK